LLLLDASGGRAKEMFFTLAESDDRTGFGNSQFNRRDPDRFLVSNDRAPSPRADLGMHHPNTSRIISGGEVGSCRDSPLAASASGGAERIDALPSARDEVSVERATQQNKRPRCFSKQKVKDWVENEYRGKFTRTEFTPALKSQFPGATDRMAREIIRERTSGRGRGRPRKIG
jgi:hypothetical protein